MNRISAWLARARSPLSHVDLSERAMKVHAARMSSGVLFICAAAATGCGKLSNTVVCPAQPPKDGDPCPNAHCAIYCEYKAVDAGPGCVEGYACDSQQAQIAPRWVAEGSYCVSPLGPGCPATAAEVPIG